MRQRWWVATLAAVAVLGLACGSLGTKSPGKKQEQFISCIRHKAWMAYFRDEKGRVAPVRDTLNTDNDEDWIGLQFTEYDGPRIRLGVLKVINKSAQAEESPGYAKIEVPVAGIQEMLTVALYNTRRFDVIEQKRIEEVLAQQKRKDVAEPSPTSIVNVGKVLGAQYLVYGTVNEWSPERASRNVGAVTPSTPAPTRRPSRSPGFSGIRNGKAPWSLSAVGNFGESLKLSPTRSVVWSDRSDGSDGSDGMVSGDQIAL
jgi:hypothetical protein